MSKPVALVDVFINLEALPLADCSYYRREIRYGNRAGRGVRLLALKRLFVRLAEVLATGRPDGLLWSTSSF